MMIRTSLFNVNVNRYTPQANKVRFGLWGEGDGKEVKAYDPQQEADELKALANTKRELAGYYDNKSLEYKDFIREAALMEKEAQAHLDGKRKPKLLFA